MSTAEHSRLLEESAGEPTMPRLLLAKCAAALLVVAVLAFVGDFTSAVHEHGTVDVGQVKAQAPG